MAHLKGRALGINMVGYLGPLTMATAGSSNSLGRRHSRYNTIWYCDLVLGREIARHPPAPRDPPGWGGVAVRQIIWRAHFSSSRRKNVATALRCAGAKPLPIEIIARQKVAPAFEPQKASGRGPPASQCNAMDASGPAALPCCLGFQHEACRDYSLSNVV